MTVSCPFATSASCASRPFTPHAPASLSSRPRLAVDAAVSAFATVASSSLLSLAGLLAGHPLARPATMESLTAELFTAASSSPTFAGAFTA